MARKRRRRTSTAQTAESPHSVQRAAREGVREPFAADRLFDEIYTPIKTETVVHVTAISFGGTEFFKAKDGEKPIVGIFTEGTMPPFELPPPANPVAENQPRRG